MLPTQLMQEMCHFSGITGEPLLHYTVTLNKTGAAK